MHAAYLQLNAGGIYATAAVTAASVCTNSFFLLCVVPSSRAHCGCVDDLACTPTSPLAHSEYEMLETERHVIHGLADTAAEQHQRQEHQRNETKRNTKKPAGKSAVRWWIVLALGAGWPIENVNECAAM